MTLLSNNKMEKDPTGFLIQASCEALQLEAGWMGNIFKIPETYAGLLTELWIKNVWHTCQHYKIKIDNNISDGMGRQDNDREIMQVIVKVGATNTDLQSINRCRMWLQVNYLSKICMGDGKKITQMAWEGMEKNQTRYKWPRTQKPTQIEWKTWQQALLVAFQLNIQRVLQQPLGQWWGMKEPSWGWYLNKDILRLYQWE